MKFGVVNTDDALGCILAHSQKVRVKMLRKGSRLGAEEIELLKAAHIKQLSVVRLEDGDMGEDEAALALATAVDGTGINVGAAGKGRVNLFASESGVVQINKAQIDAANRLDPSLTIATLGEWAAVRQGQMIATIKVIPFAAAHDLVHEVIQLLRGSIQVLPYKCLNICVISTLLPSLSQGVIDKTLRVLGDRLEGTGSKVTQDLRIDHHQEALQECLTKEVDPKTDLIIIFGASAVIDRHDIIPKTIDEAGGEVIQYGMPVDPGNLLVLARLKNIPVIGAPGCARSPKENGFDWVLQRLLVGLPPSDIDIRSMGVGGLLNEIISRPQPRRQSEDLLSYRFAGLLLAAGQSKRMGDENKLLIDIDGETMVRRVAKTILASQVDHLFVVTGHEETRIKNALSGLDVTFVHNVDYEKGLATSLKAGINHLSEHAGDVEGFFVCLGDMPDIESELFEQMIKLYQPQHGQLVVVPIFNGQRGLPVLWSMRYRDQLLSLKGDEGARHIIAEMGAEMVEIDVQSDAVLRDLDTIEAVESYIKSKPRKLA